ncbi:NUDIX hydrolase [Nigerium massiliense]|uniref:NUDIX hydrolase n=1 Tax=Nigerium massiliense TaxID=1522317 RepID=UPI00058F4569|nr:NUDIX domain-containing protein [Nigerium massiliense]
MTGEFFVAAVVLRDAAGRVAMVRKRETTMFMLPGGKIEPGETPDATACREIAEELGVALDRAHLVSWGSYRTPTANEPGFVLNSDVFAYTVPVAGAAPAAEIVELAWVDPAQGPADDWAPLTVALLPRLRG